MATLPLKNMEPRLLLVLCLAITALYAGAHSLWYSTTSLGIVPVLDGKENCQLAVQISEGKLPHEPFYRAPLYPIVLALTLKLGGTETSLPHIARLINGIAHILSTALVFYISLRLWSNKWAATLSALLFGINPVLIFFASDPLDITLAITCMLGGLFFALKAIQKECLTPSKYALYAGIYFGLASLTRSHFLTLACTWPLLAWIFTRKPGSFFTGLSAPIIGLGALGLINAVCANQWTMLPTQGPYNLWAANKHHANGRYFEQSIQIKAQKTYKNPARIESEFIYYQTSGATQPAPLAEINAFWRAQTWELIANYPKQFLKSLLKKSLFLIRNDEYYNNKTFWVHKELSPILSWNALCWSGLLCLGVFGLVAQLPRKDLFMFAIFSLFFAAGVILFYVSARFRLPLYAFLSIFSGGILALPPKPWKRLSFYAAYFFAGTLTALSIIPLKHAPKQTTEAEDYLLLAQSSAELGWDGDAYQWAQRSYQIAPDRAATLELLVTSFYNQLLTGLPQLPPRKDIEDSLLISMRIIPTHPEIAYITGVYLWILDDHNAAIHFWRELARTQGPGAQDALAALLITHTINAREHEYIRHMSPENKTLTLLLSESLEGDMRATQELTQRIPTEAIRLEKRRLEMLFN